MKTEKSRSEKLRGSLASLQIGKGQQGRVYRTPLTCLRPANLKPPKGNVVFKVTTEKVAAREKKVADYIRDQTKRSPFILIPGPEICEQIEGLEPNMRGMYIKIGGESLDNVLSNSDEKINGTQFHITCKNYVT